MVIRVVVMYVGDAISTKDVRDHTSMMSIPLLHGRAKLAGYY